MKVKFVPQNVEIEIKPGQTVMAVAHEHNIPIRSTCNGMPSCAECRVRVIDGDWNVNPPSRKELSLIGTGYYIDQRRLSCQVLCFGDITVDTQEQLEKTAEGPVTKKFLTKVHKATAAESFSLGGVMIEQDSSLLKEVEKDVKPMQGGPVSEAVQESRGNRGGGGGGGGRDRGGRGGGGGNRGPQAQGGRGPQGGAPNSNAPGTGEGGEGAGGGNRRGGRGRRRRR